MQLKKWPHRKSGGRKGSCKMMMHHAPSRRKREALPLGELPLFKWANARPLQRPADSVAVIAFAHRYRLLVSTARTIAEVAGFPTEARNG
jgi:hypothetical protein